jgi:hypothetical protein
MIADFFTMHPVLGVILKIILVSILTAIIIVSVVATTKPEDWE